MLDLLNNDLARDTGRSHALSASTHVFVASRCFATGSFQQVAGDLQGISEASVCKCVLSVAGALCHHVDKYLKFPMQNKIFMIWQAFQMCWGQLMESL